MTLRITRKSCCCVTQAENVFSLQAEKSDWLADTDEEIDDKEWKHITFYMAKIKMFLMQTQCTYSEPIRTGKASQNPNNKSDLRTLFMWGPEESATDRVFAGHIDSSNATVSARLLHLRNPTAHDMEISEVIPTFDAPVTPADVTATSMNGRKQLITPICLMAKASPTQHGMGHRRLPHLNFDYINSFQRKMLLIGLPKLKYGAKDQLVPLMK
ncbi:hypothetical protein Tco_1066705 [Tanacetum coccineum]|uniref:Uncharacterized protein n=1 Tax=Tanacetum coccineum TaxID=301880 RepID=A0ABQ5HB61_9ASTR